MGQQLRPCGGLSDDGACWRRDDGRHREEGEEAQPTHTREYLVRVRLRAKVGARIRAGVWARVWVRVRVRVRVTLRP